MKNIFSKEARIGRKAKKMRKLYKELRATLRDPDGWLWDVLTGGKETNVSGQTVNEQTAMGLAAYFACIRNISEDIAKVPLNVRRQLRPRGNEFLYDHPVQKLLHDKANPEMTAFSFREVLTANALGYHGGFAEIQRDGAGRPLALWPIDPTTVTVSRTVGTNDLVYEIRDGATTKILEADSVFHLHGLGFDGRTGYALTSIGAESLGAAIGIQKFNASFFSHGACLSGALQVPGKMDKPALDMLKASFNDAFTNASNSHKVILLEHGVEFNPFSIDPEKAQMIESMFGSIVEICRWFRMPPHKIQFLLYATYSNITSQAKEYVDDCLYAWFVRWEQEIRRKLFNPNTERDLYAKHNVTALLRGDPDSRANYYIKMWNAGCLSINDIRELEDLNPIGPAGDVYYVPLHMMPADEAMKNRVEIKKIVDDSQDTQDTQDENESDSKKNNQKDEDSQERSLNEVYLAHHSLLERVFSKFLSVEKDKVTRALRRKNFTEWFDEFCVEHRNHVCPAITDVIDAYTSSIWATKHKNSLPSNIRSLIVYTTNNILDEYIQESRALVESKQDWSPEIRARDLATKSMQHLDFILKLGAKE